MKKIIAMLLMLGLLLTGCAPAAPVVTVAPTQTTAPPVETEPPEPQLSLVVLEVGDPTNLEDGGIHTYDYPLWSPEKYYTHNREEAPRQMDVTVDGQSWTAAYRFSAVDIPDNFVRDYYYTKDMSFALNAETGELVYWQNTGHISQNYVPEEQLKSAADAYAARLLKLEDYVCEAKIQETCVMPADTQCVYTRYVGGYPTNDRLRLLVAVSGDVTSVRQDELGSFAPENLPDDFDRQLALLSPEQVEAALEEKLQTIYRELFQTHPEASYTYTIHRQTLAMLPGDTLCLHNQMDLQLHVPGREVQNVFLQLAVKCQREGEPLPVSSGPDFRPEQILTAQAGELPLQAYRMSRLNVGHTTVYPNEYPHWDPEPETDWLTQDAPWDLTLRFGDDLVGHRHGAARFAPDQQVTFYMVGTYDGAQKFFSIDYDTGLPVAVCLTEWHSGNMTIEACQETADFYAEEYMQQEGWVRERHALGQLYRYLYYRYAPGERVCDWMVVTIASSGSLHSFFRGTLELPEGEEDCLPRIRALLSGEAEELFARKRDETRDVLKQNVYMQRQAYNAKNDDLGQWSDYRSRCIICDMRLVFLPDGSLGTLYTLEYRIWDHDYRRTDFRTELLLICGENG